MVGVYSVICFEYVYIYIYILFLWWLWRIERYSVYDRLIIDRTSNKETWLRKVSNVSYYIRLEWKVLFHKYLYQSLSQIIMDFIGM